MASNRHLTGKRTLWQTIISWFDAYSFEHKMTASGSRKIDWVRTVPFIALHLCVLFVFVVGWSPVAVAAAVLLYALRMFAITGFYHRYFSHKAFKTSRPVQFIFAAIGAMSAQRGPLWWASHHRLHHLHADSEHDQHSPAQQGFLWSHMGWFLSRENFSTRHDRIDDFAQFPELRFLDRFDILMPILLALSLFGLGEFLHYYYPSTGTTGLQMVVWGFVISTIVLYHITFMINSVAHQSGHQRFKTRDTSRNNLLLALLTFGEGWHNNHHFFPGSARQGFTWWEIDITYYLLRLLQWAGLIHELRPVPEFILNKRSKNRLKPARDVI